MLEPRPGLWLAIALALLGLAACSSSPSADAAIDGTVSFDHVLGEGRRSDAGTSPDRGGVPPTPWSKLLGGPGNDQGYAVAVDGSGTVCVAGTFEQTVNLGGDPLASAGLQDVFVACYGPTGAHRWSKRFGGPGRDIGWGVAIDGSGNVTVTGSFEDTVDFGGGSRASAGSADVFVASYGPSGAYRWSKLLGGPAQDFGHAVAVDGSGNVTVTGFCQGTVDLGDGAVGGGLDAFVVRYDPSGAYRWSKRFGGGDGTYGRGVAVDGSGAVALTGDFSGTVSFGGDPLISAGAADVFVASYGLSGGHRWSKRLGGAAADSALGVTVDRSGDVAITGSFSGTADLGEGPVASAGGSDIFVASYGAATGAYRWSKHFGGTANDSGWGIAADASGDVVVTGYFRETIDLGGGALTSAGGCDLFVARYGSGGVHRSSKRLGGTGNDVAHGLALGASGGLAVTGAAADGVDLGAGPLAGAGGNDAFLVQLVP